MAKGTEAHLGAKRTRKRREEEERILHLAELERDRFLRFLIERDPASKINSIFPKWIDCTGFFPENERYEPVEVELRVDYQDEGGWFHSEEFSSWRSCELKRREGRILLPLGDLLHKAIWSLSYGDGKDPALAKRLKRAERLRLKFGRVTCARKRKKRGQGRP